MFTSGQFTLQSVTRAAKRGRQYCVPLAAFKIFVIYCLSFTFCRNLIECKAEPLSTAVEAIVRSDNDDLLSRFISDAREVRVVDGVLVCDEETIPAITFSIRGLALRSASTLLKVGVRASQEECAEIMRIAFENDDIEAIGQFLKDEDKNTLRRYLFEVVRTPVVNTDIYLGVFNKHHELNIMCINRPLKEGVLRPSASLLTNWRLFARLST